MRSVLHVAIAFAALMLCAASTASAQGRIIIVNGNAPGVGFNDPTPAAQVGGNPGTTPGEQRMNVFLFAAGIWTQVLNPKVDIYVYARFVPLAANVLGSAGPISVSRGFPGAEYPDLWYHAALANHLRGFDDVPHDPTFVPDPVTDAPNPTDEINARFATDLTFYFGFDNEEPPGTVDLLPVVLHELGHGLGFGNLVNEGTGTQFPASDPHGDVYSQYTFDDVTGRIWNAMTDAERAASALNIRKVSWSGLNVKKDVPMVLSPGEPALIGNSAGFSGAFLIGMASFGEPFTTVGLTADVVPASDGVGAPGDACEPVVSAVAGKIALMDRGTCGFTVKVRNAQDAGAIGVLVADNVAGSPPAGLGGADPTILIPSGRITLADGNALKAALASGTVNVTMKIDTSILAGTDRINKLMLLATFDPVLLGSSIGHFDSVAFRNQLMEPAFNPDLTASVTPPEDLTTSLLTDIGWYADGDGIPDGKDSCIGSDTRPTVVLGRCNSRAGNDVMADGCTVSDRLDECADPRPARYLACITRKTQELRRNRVVTPLEEAGIVFCAVSRTVRP